MKHLLMIVFVLLFGCTSENLTEAEYIKWVESIDNGLKIEKAMDKFQFTLQYKPSKYILLKEQNKTGRTINADEFSGVQQFNLRMEAVGSKTEMLKEGITTEEEYFQRIEYFIGQAQQDIKLIDGKDTLDCILYHFERSYNMAPYNNLVLGFPVVNKEEVHDKILSYNDQVLGVGKINLKIEKKDLMKLEQIIIQ